MTIKFIDDFVIIPGAMGCLLTGIAYSSLTNWGWFKHNWIIIKWIITIYGILFGTFFLGPWVNGLVPIAKEMGLKALSDTEYIHSRTMLYYFGSFQLATLIFAAYLSIFKPWKRSKKKVNP